MLVEGEDLVLGCDRAGRCGVDGLNRRLDPARPWETRDDTLWETGGFQKALYQHVDTVT